MNRFILLCFLLVVCSATPTATSSANAQPTPSIPGTLPPTTTVVDISPTDLCSAFVEQSCPDEIASTDMLRVMQCAKKVLSGFASSSSTLVAEAACMLQSKGSIALVCSADFETNCDETSTFEDLKECTEDYLDDFSDACQISIENFKDKLHSAQKRLDKKQHKHHKHHSTTTSNGSKYQWLWGGEIVSDPDPSKWRRMWHKWGKWVGGSLVLIFIVLVCCWRRKRCLARHARMQQSASEGEVSIPEEGNWGRHHRCWTGRWARWPGSFFSNAPQENILSAPLNYNPTVTPTAHPVSMEQIHASSVPANTV